MNGWNRSIHDSASTIHEHAAAEACPEGILTTPGFGVSCIFHFARLWRGQRPRICLAKSSTSNRRVANSDSVEEVRSLPANHTNEKIERSPRDRENIRVHLRDSRATFPKTWHICPRFYLYKTVSVIGLSRDSWIEMNVGFL